MSHSGLSAQFINHWTTFGLEINTSPPSGVQVSWELIDKKKGDESNFKDVRGLKIQNLIIEVFPSKLLNVFPNLRSIVIQGSISKIDKDTFKNTTQLESVMLVSLSLEEVSSSLFENNKMIKSINLSDNKLNDIPNSIFSYQTDLRSIILGQNKLTNLHEDLFIHSTDLESLILSHNELETLPNRIFSNNEKLNFLGLRNNRFKFLPDDLFLNTPNLRQITLNGNPLETIPISLYELRDQLIEPIERQIKQMKETLEETIKQMEESAKKSMYGDSVRASFPAIRSDTFNSIRIIREQNALLLKLMEEKRKGIELQNRHDSIHGRLLGFIEKVSDNIPVQLTRIAEICDQPKNEVYVVLKEILRKNSSLGEFLELEQVYIKRVQTHVPDTDTVTKKTNIEFFHSCSKCNETLSTLIRTCTNCNQELPFCNICKRGFSGNDNLLQCSHCENEFHKTHLFVYIQAEGMCPVCKNHLTLSQFDN